MKNKKLEEYLRSNPDKKPFEVSKVFGIAERTIRAYRRELGLKPHQANKELNEKILSDSEMAEFLGEELKKEKEHKDEKRAIKHLLSEKERLENELATFKSAKATKEHLSLSGFTRHPDGATAVILASDWHIEEPVKSKDVNGLNEFNLQVAEKRVATFWQSVAKLISAKQKSLKIEDAVLCLLGDFFSGYIHEELMAVNEAGPSQAVVRAYAWIRDGLKNLLDKKLVKKMVVVCHSGNHARMSKKCWVAGEELMSLESIIYHLLSQEFGNRQDVEFVIPSGYHGYVDIHGFNMRTHHGHAIRYAGGVGGIYIPALKAVNQWNKARKADLDVFGHLHQFRYGGNFVCNGSLIGYGPFSVWIKGDYEVPSQTFFLVHHARKQVTDICPIWLE